ncbi:MAG: TRAP transporter small permease [Clostridia bacterium]|nr:TRAP transporter small permease [Clostridia bacterium]MDH7573710.1 TRAP transporter small permease [Clostridia bacterium]
MRPVARLSKAFNYVSCATLFLMVLLVFVNVVGRYLLNLPVPGAVELIQLGMAVVVGLGFGYCAIEHRNVRVDLLMERLPRRVQEVVDSVTCCLSIVTACLLAWQIGVQGYELIRAGRASVELHIPFYPFYLILAVGWGVLAVALLGDLAGLLDALRKRGGTHE